MITKFSPQRDVRISDRDTILQVLAAAQIYDVEIYSIETAPGGVVLIEGNRYLTAPEKIAVLGVIQNLTAARIEDVVY